MSVYELPKDRVVYNYRYFLPYAPEWGSEELCARRLQELLEFCRDARVDAVQFFVNTTPGTYYMPPASAREQRHWVAWMRDTVAPAVRDAGISYQLNFQMLLGASSWNLDMRDNYDWDFLVSQHGQESQGCPCPISPRFREKMGEMLRAWASTLPDVFWIDDDFRLHNHGVSLGECDFYCFCDRHLRLFSEYTGLWRTRDELVADILSPGEPSDTRNQWLDFTGETMAGTAAWIREQVHAVSPDSRLALMTSAPDVHSVEGRDWNALLTALCGAHRPMTRPCAGIYSGTMVPLKNHSLTFRFMAQSIAVLDHVFGDGRAEFGPELENTRFTTWCKSRSNTQFVLVLGQLLGCAQITASLNDLDGSPISEEPSIVHVLSESKPMLQALADLRLRTWQPEGVAFLIDPGSARRVQVGSEARMQDLGLIREFEDPLLQLGIPARYATAAEAADSGCAVVLEGYTAWLPSDDELQRIMSRGVLMDSAAAEVLQRRGFEGMAGVRVLDPRDYGIVSEQYLDNVLPGVHACRVPHRGMRWRGLEPKGAVLASEFIDSGNRHHPGCTVYENDLGGRAVVYASVGDLSPYGTFGSHARLRWLHGALRWISHDKFPAMPVVPHHALCVVRSRRDESLLALANLGADNLRDVTVRVPLARPLETVSVIRGSGVWKQEDCRCDSTDSPGVFLLSLPCRLAPFEWVVALLRGLGNVPR